eukprot:5505437-Prymnesium_polylepis.1
MAAGGASALCFTIATNTSMLVSWCTWRLFSALVWSAAMMTVLEWVDEEHAGRAASVLGLSNQLGKILGNLNVSWMLSFPFIDSWRLCFFNAAGLALATFTLLL